jgi:hypothetical protein
MEPSFLHDAFVCAPLYRKIAIEPGANPTECRDQRTGNHNKIGFNTSLHCLVGALVQRRKEQQLVRENLGFICDGARLVLVSVDERLGARDDSSGRDLNNGC